MHYFSVVVVFLVRPGSLGGLLTHFCKLCLSERQQVLNPNPSKPHPCKMPLAKPEVALQFSESCAADFALQHSLFCSADVICYQKLRCNKRKTALQHRRSCAAGKTGAFLGISGSHVYAPTFRSSWECNQ